MRDLLRNKARRIERSNSVEGGSANSDDDEGTAAAAGGGEGSEGEPEAADNSSDCGSRGGASPSPTAASPSILDA